MELKSSLLIAPAVWTTTVAPWTVAGADAAVPALVKLLPARIAGGFGDSEVGKHAVARNGQHLNEERTRDGIVKLSASACKT